MASGCPCLVVIFFFMGIALIYDGLKQHLLMQKIKNTPTSKVRSAAVGLVELFGKARFKKEMHSPFAKKKCAYWRIVAQYYRSGKHGGWRNMHRADSSTPFYLQDDTGRMLVDPRGAQVEIPKDRLYTGHLTGKGLIFKHKKIDEKVLNYVNKKGNEEIKKKFLRHNYQKLRVFEYYIAEGDKVYVLGSAQPREGAPSHIGYENLIVRKGKFERVMYIADSHEKIILRGKRQKALLEVFGGLALSSVCLLITLLFMQSYFTG